MTPQDRRGSRILLSPREQEQQQLERVNRRLSYTPGSSPSVSEPSPARGDQQQCHQSIHQPSRRSQAHSLSHCFDDLENRPPVRNTAHRSPPARQAEPASRQALKVENGQHRSSASALALQAGRPQVGSAQHRFIRKPTQPANSEVCVVAAGSVLGRKRRASVSPHRGECLVLPSGSSDPKASRKACKRAGNHHPRGPSVAEQAVVARAASSQDRPANRAANRAAVPQNRGPQQVFRIPALESSYVEDLRLALEDLGISDATISLTCKGMPKYCSLEHLQAMVHGQQPFDPLMHISCCFLCSYNCCSTQ